LLEEEKAMKNLGLSDKRDGSKRINKVGLISALILGVAFICVAVSKEVGFIFRLYLFITGAVLLWVAGYFAVLNRRVDQKLLRISEEAKEVDKLTPREIRDRQPKLIRKIIEELKGEINYPRAKIHTVYRDFAGIMRVDEIAVDESGYGLAIIRGLLFQKKEKRLVEIDCESEEGFIGAILQVETFEPIVVEQTYLVMERFRDEIMKIFGGIEYMHYNKQLTEFDQSVNTCKEIIRPLIERKGI
jgi:hypothetical protein